MLSLAGQLRIQARANRLANHRLHAAMVALSEGEFHAPRTSFFPSLAATLNHILVVDAYYIGALHGDTGLVLIAWCDALTDAGCDAMVDMDRGEHVQRDRAAHVLAHLFMHQTHHRGQAHAMLAGTAVAPPQLDEFLMPSDDRFRAADMAALGWREDQVYG